MVNQMIEKKEDLTQPIIVIPNIDGRPEVMQDADETFNRYVMCSSESHGKRTQIRFAFEVWCRPRARMAYARLRNKHVVLSFPSVEQADLAIEILRDVCKSLEGKHLAKR
jgi:uncharacterized protein YxeA